MLLMNLVPRDRRESEPSAIDQHPFFESLLGISGKGGNPVLVQIIESDLATQASFLTLSARAFAAYSMASPMAYRRVAELTREERVRESARRFVDLEEGRPSQTDSDVGVSRLESFRRMIESLLPGLTLRFGEPEAFLLHRSLGINRAPLIEALALCEEIEISGRGTVAAWQDLVAQWQVFQGVRTRVLNRAYLDEHSPVEGGRGKNQHLQLFEEMIAPYAELRGSIDYGLARSKIRREMFRHFDDAVREVLERCVRD